jgi:hypothetical protein
MAVQPPIYQIICGKLGKWADIGVISRVRSRITPWNFQESDFEKEIYFVAETRNT